MSSFFSVLNHFTISNDDKNEIIIDIISISKYYDYNFEINKYVSIKKIWNNDSFNRRI
jgi:hypothetical protein